MKKTIILVFALMAFPACKPDPDDFEIGRRPYTGNRPRIDGYYYTAYQEDGSFHLNTFLLYQNGTFLYAGTLSDKAKLADLKNADQMMLNNFKGYINQIPGWGVFQVNGDEFVMERWESNSPARKIGTFCEYGKVTSDTTILIDIGPGPSATYTFRKFSPKPDSTNCYIH